MTKQFNCMMIGGVGVLLSSYAQADFFKDSTASLMLQNYYMDSDYRNEKTATRPQQSKKEEWAQGATLNFTSGFTEGTVGVGLDVLVMLGVKLYADPDSSGTGLLPVSSTTLAGHPSYAHEAKDIYSKVGATAKIKYDNNLLKYGAIIPKDVPVLLANNARLFSQSFRGWEFQSTQIPKVNFKAGWIDRVKQRDAVTYDELGIDTGYTRYTQSRPSDHYIYAGLDYKFSTDLVGSYYFSQLKDSYKQHYLGMKAYRKLGIGKLTTDVRYFKSSDDGEALAGKINNQMYTASFSYKLQHHQFDWGYQKVDGGQALPYLKGAGPYTPTTVMVSYFILPHERTWWVKYDYDFAGLGVPGLTVSNKYLSGSHAKISGSTQEQKEWEWDKELAYTVQTGKFKNLSLRLRHATFRSTLDRAIDQTRVILTYTFHLK
ncbi:MAG: OprD family outer membrane porin [Acinetobacter sp.]